MILTIIINKVLPILPLGIGFAFAIIVGFSNVEIIPLHINIHGEVDNFTLHCSVALCLHQIQIEIAVNRLICRKKYVSLHIINNE